MKNDQISQKILMVAKREFMEKGYQDASMRTIAEKVNLTTGALYNRFKYKEEIFQAIVEEGASQLMDYYVSIQDEFAHFSPLRQRQEMHSYVHEKKDKMIDIIYDHFDAFKLIVCKSNGSKYEHFIDELIEIETSNTIRFIDDLRKENIPCEHVRDDLNHMLASAMFNGVFEVVAHDMKKEDAKVYIDQIFDFFDAGWDHLLKLNEKI